MADITQSEDYQVLQAMRTEISGLVDSKNRLDSEIKKLEEDKLQMELEINSVRAKLDDVNGEWSAKMRKLIDFEKQLNGWEAEYLERKNAFEAEVKERQSTLEYLEAKAKKDEQVSQQNKAESDKLLADNRHLEQKHALQGKRLQELEAQLEAKRKDLVSLEATLDKHSRDITEAMAKVKEREREADTAIEDLRKMSSVVTKDNNRMREETMAREQELFAREQMVADRMKQLDKREATLDTRINKSEADRILKLSQETEAKRLKLNEERSEFEREMKEVDNKVHFLQGEIDKKHAELTGLEEKLRDIERREKGVADMEAGLQAKEKQLMFQIATFKKRLKDANMEEVINEFGK